MCNLVRSICDAVYAHIISYAVYHDVISYTVLCSIMHNGNMLALCNHMNLVRIPRRDRMYLAYCMHDSRRDRDMRSRSPKCMMHRNRS